jgi:hypothetical protein
MINKSLVFSNESCVYVFCLISDEDERAPEERMRIFAFLDQF